MDAASLRTCEAHCVAFAAGASRYQGLARTGLQAANTLVNLHLQTLYADGSFLGPLADFEGLGEKIEGQLHREFTATYARLGAFMAEMEQVIGQLRDATTGLESIWVATAQAVGQEEAGRVRVGSCSLHYLVRALSDLLHKHQSDLCIKHRIYSDLCNPRPASTHHLYLIGWLSAPHIDKNAGVYLDALEMVGREGKDGEGWVEG